MFAFFGLSFYSSRIYRLLRGGVSYSEGNGCYCFGCFSFRVCTRIISDGNITPVLGYLIAFACYSWMRGRQVGVGMAMIPLILFNRFGPTWCPMLLLRRVQWRTLFTLACLAVILNGLTLYLGGAGVYRQFFIEVAPRLNVPTGIGVTAKIFANFGFYPGIAYSAVSFALCALLYWGYWRALGVRIYSVWRTAVAATLAGSMAVFCLLNFSIWLHYFPSYLYFPFLGWILWEGYQATGGWRIAILSWIIGCFICVSSEWIVMGVMFHLFGAEAVDIYRRFAEPAVFTFFGPIFFLIVAFRRLFFMPTPVRPAPLSVEIA